MKTSLEKIRLKIAGAPRFAVSAELDRRVLGSIGQAEAQVPQAELAEEGILFQEGWLSDWLKRSFRQFSYVAIILAVVLAGSWLLNQDSYSIHLNRAQVALANLQSVLDGKPIATASLVPSAWAEESAPAAVSIDDSQVVDLTQAVVRETESAIGLAGKGTDPAEVRQALSEVLGFQDQTFPVFSEAVDAVRSDEALQSVADALDKTTTDQSVVAKAQAFVVQAAQRGEKRVAIDIETSAPAKPLVAVVPQAGVERSMAKIADSGNGDFAPAPSLMATAEPVASDPLLDQAKGEYQRAKALVEQLKGMSIDGGTLLDLQSKMDRVVSAFGDGKIGRAHGLAQAILAEGKHLVLGADANVQGQQPDNNGKANDPKSLNRADPVRGEGQTEDSNGVPTEVTRPEAKTDAQPSDPKGFGQDGLKAKDLKVGLPYASGVPGDLVKSQPDKADQIRATPTSLKSPELGGSHPRIPKAEYPGAGQPKKRAQWGGR
jgi:hypothetical protein